MEIDLQAATIQKTMNLDMFLLHNASLHKEGGNILPLISLKLYNLNLI